MSHYNRRHFLKTTSAASVPLAFSCTQGGMENQKRPSLLMLMSDNHSWNHLGCYGDSVVKTPNIDAIAEQGIRFTHAFCAAPSCTPARAGILTGQDIWRLEEGANLWGFLPRKFPIYTEILENSGYFVGSEGKGWGPGSIEDSGRGKNPAGKTYASFDNFLAANTEKKPWCYWYSTSDPHRPYDVGSGVASGMDERRVSVPPYLPDCRDVRGDICDYYYEIQKFDSDVGRFLQKLEETGQIENTVIIICSDNGWQMPRGLANLYDFGTRVPLIIFWKRCIPKKRVVDDFVNLNDLAPTFLELAGQHIPEHMTAKSLVHILLSEKSGRIEPNRDFIITARERHAFCRKNGLGYPCRAIRTYDYLYIRNCEPDRWPAGDPPLFGDIDAHMLHYPCPTKMYMMANRDAPDVKSLFELGFLKRSAEELYNLTNDPFQMNNVVYQKEYSRVREKLSQKLDTHLKATGDPRAIGRTIIWDSTRYYQEIDFTPQPSKEADSRIATFIRHLHSTLQH